MNKKIEQAKGRALIELRKIFAKTIRTITDRTQRAKAQEKLKTDVESLKNQASLAKEQSAGFNLETLQKKGPELIEKFRVLEPITKFRERAETIEARRIARRPAVKREIPFGIEAIIKGKREIVLGEKFTPFAPINFFARKGAESKKVRAIADEFVKQFPAIGQLATLAASSEDPKRVLSFISIAQLGILFDPAIRTGGTQEQRLIRKKLSENRFKDLDIDDVINDLQRKQTGKTIRSKTLGEKVDDARKIFNKIRETKDPKLRVKQIKEFKLLMKTSHGEAGANQIFNELITQEGVLGVQRGIVTRVPRPPAPRRVVVEPLPQIKAVGIVPSIIQSPRERARVRGAQVRRQKEIQKSKQTLGQRFQQAQKSALAQKSAQAQKIAQKQRTAQRQRVALALVPKLVTKAPQVKTTKLGIKTTFLKPVKRFIIIKKKPAKKKKIVVKKIPTVMLGYNVKIRSKGKLKKLNVVPLTKFRARDLGSFIADKSTARTFVLSRAATKAQKPKLKVPSSYFARNKRKFRGPKKKGKVQPLNNKAIEKRKFAIDSRGEIKGLSAARLRSRLFKEFKKRKRK